MSFKTNIEIANHVSKIEIIEMWSDHVSISDYIMEKFIMTYYNI